MKNREIEKLIKEFVFNHRNANLFREPVIKFADAKDKLFTQLKKLHPFHVLPENLLSGVKTVIVYFIPFNKEIVYSNFKEKVSSKQWAKAYIFTNNLIEKLNIYIKNKLQKLNFATEAISGTHNFDKNLLVSYWSHRHAGYIAGLGKFGLNNMLITKMGCCGRLGSILTTLYLEPSKRDNIEYCLFKLNGNCQKCISRCQYKALTLNTFNRTLCYKVCLKNAKVHSSIGFADVCGKCCVNLPCSFKIPVE